MVGVIRDIVIPMKAGEMKGEAPVFTIVCEILTTPVEDEAGQAQVSTLWKVRSRCVVQQEPQPPSTSCHHLLPSLDQAAQMASAWRVISFFLVVFVLPTVLISLPLYARYHLYHARHMPMTETDTRALNHAVSSFWCQGQRVTSNGTLDAFLVAGTPQVLEQRRHVTLKRNLTLRHDDIEYWGVYLLQGSTFALSSCSRWPGGVLLVVRGEDNLRKCFYREHRLQNELNGGTSPVTNVYKSPPDVEEETDDEISEQRHWEEENVGGEVFDDDYEEKTKNRDSDLSPLAPNDKIRLHKYHLVDKVEAITKRKNRKNKKDKKESKVEARHGRSRRSGGGDRFRRSGSLLQDSSVRHEEPMPKPSSNAMDLLHKFNDTVDVLTGNSSFSSSEEFLEQCRDSILKVDLTPYIDWESRINKMDATNPNFWKFNVNSSDYYYFIFTSDNSIELNHLGFNLQLDRATYDVSSPLETCRNSTECVFSLAFTQTEAVVVEVPAEENLQELHSFEVTTTCQPRVPVYMVFILLVPFIILLFAFQ